MAIIIERMQNARGTAAQWTSSNPTLLAGEVGYETDTRRWKMGDGSTAWTSLPYGGEKVLSSKTTAYTFALDDAMKFTTMNSASAQALTIPPNSSVAFPIGTLLEGARLGAGTATLTAGAGVTLQGTLVAPAQYASFRARKIATDTWICSYN